jgi:serine/threonine protein kinase/WD40 repeat protein
MNEPSRCPACGLLLPAHRLTGLCPACAWESLGNFADPDVLPRAAAPCSIGRTDVLLMRVAGYEVLQEIARGGMGIVYRARQLDPSRTVALKMLLPHQLGSPGMAERFRLEVRALTELEHPAILPVYHVGEQDGLPFFTMKLATGGTLAERKQQYLGNWRAIADLLATLADAVQFAHEHGVLHRDLKPGNVLFDDAGRAYVSDFGLAKLASAETNLTRSLDFLGTPHYVAPEIAASSARQATTASDIYALGAILYELLTGQPPFEAEGIPALLKKIAEEDPTAPSEVLARARNQESDLQHVPRDLEVICLKCLAKEPAGRYPSARAIANDLRCWLAGEPITARPVSRRERAWKWIRRNPVPASMAAALAVCLIGGGLALWKSYRDVRAALGSTSLAENHAQQNLRESLLAQAKALGAARGMGQRWQALDAIARAARIEPSVELRNEAAAALARPDLREVVRFPATFGDAGSSAVFTSDLERYITPEPRGGFVLRGTRNQKVLASFPGALHRPARWFVLNADDSQVAALLDDYSLEVWGLDDKQPRLRWQGTIQQPPVCEFNADATSLAVFVPGQGLFMHRAAGNDQPLLQFTNGRALYLRFDPSGERLAVVHEPGGVEVLRCTGTPSVLWSQPMSKAVPWLAWSPDGSKLVAAGDDGRGIRVFSADSGQTELAYSRHLLYPRQFEVHPNGRTIASVGQDWVLRLWDSRTGQDLVTGVGRHRVVRFSRDGRRLTTAPNDHELCVLELAPEQVFREFRSTPAAQGAGEGLASSDDGRWLLTTQPQVRLYDTERAEEAAVLNLTASRRHVFFEKSKDAVFYSYLDRGLYEREFSQETNGLNAGAMVRWGKEKLVAKHPASIIADIIEAGHTSVRQSNESVELWSEHDPARARRLNIRAPFDLLAISQNARWAASPNLVKQQITIWDCHSDRVQTNLPARGPARVWFSPESGWLVACVENGYCTWETGTWRPGPSWEARLDSGDPGEVAFCANGRLIAARQERETFRLLSFPECRELVTLKPPLVLPVRSACLSPDGSRLWLLAAGFRLFEWNLANLREELMRAGLDWQ